MKASKVQTKYNATIKECRQGFREVLEDMPDIDITCLAHEVAESLLMEEPWIEVYLSSIGVTDPKGRVANEIASQ